MRKLLLSLALVALATTAFAQTNNAPTILENPPSSTPTLSLADQFHNGVVGFADSVTTATNWDVHIGAMYFDALKEHYAVRAGFDYLITPIAHATLSLMLHDGTLYGMTGTFTIKKAFDIGKNGYLRLTIGAESGVGEVISGLQFGNFTVPGKAINSGQFFGDFGTHVVLSFPKWKYLPDVIAGYEKMSNMPGNIYSGELHWPLHVFTDWL